MIKGLKTSVWKDELVASSARGALVRRERLHSSLRLQKSVCLH